MSKAQLLEKLQDLELRDVDNKRVPTLIIRFDGENEKLRRKRDEDSYEAHTGGNTGGSSNTSCTAPHISPF